MVEPVPCLFYEPAESLTYDFDRFEEKITKESEDDEDWKWFGETNWIKNGLRVKNLERENLAQNLGWNPDLEFWMLKMEVRDGFEWIKWWRMIFLTQFDVKMEENDGFWSEIKRGENGF